MEEPANGVQGLLSRKQAVEGRLEDVGHTVPDHSHVRHFKLQARDFFCLLMSKQAVRFDCDWVRLEAQSQNDGRSSSDTRIGTAGPDASWSCLGLGTSVGKSRLIVAARVLRP